MRSSLIATIILSMPVACKTKEAEPSIQVEQNPFFKPSESSASPQTPETIQPDLHLLMSQEKDIPAPADHTNPSYLKSIGKTQSAEEQDRLWLNQFRRQTHQDSLRWVRNAHTTVHIKPNGPVAKIIDRGRTIIIQESKDGWYKTKAGLYIHHENLSLTPVKEGSEWGENDLNFMFDDAAIHRESNQEP